MCKGPVVGSDGLLLLGTEKSVRLWDRDTEACHIEIRCWHWEWLPVAGDTQDSSLRPGDLGWTDTAQEDPGLEAASLGTLLSLGLSMPGVP